ncbi:TIGR00270 family protein [Candidatus Micrarchaeota archaeon]|nr:TIGR00270 family protein [Candidatus Micrarchaeota archaeon]
MVELSCDICGNTPIRAQIFLEGAKLLVCGRCMKSGKIIHKFYEDEPVEEAPQPRSRATATEEVVEGFAKIIKEGRQKLKLPLAVVAERISEKESYLQAIEGGRLTPTMEVAKKLEKELGVQLIEKAEKSIAPSRMSSGRFTEPTLGDMVGDD